MRYLSELKRPRALGAFLCALLSGCTVGPDYVRPAVEVPEAYKEALQWQPARPRDDTSKGRWWEVYGDPQLNSLLEQVNVSNQTLIAAEAAFRQSVAAADSARAAWYPTAAATVSKTNSLPSSTTGPIIGIPSSKRTIWSAPLNASWVPDLWGQVRRAVEAGEATAQASWGTLENARLSMQSQVAQNYFQLRALDSQKRLLDATLEAYAKSLELTRNRYAAGVAARLDVAQAEAQLKAAKVQALDLEAQRAPHEHAIAVMLGRPPAGFSIAFAPLAVKPPAVPAALPADLLERRPDIAAAERSVAAANAQIGVAEAAWFPSATLSATWGYQTAASSQWFKAPSRFWSFGPSFAETLFDGGKRRAASAQAVASFDASVANYRQAVLAGFQQVEDNLSALRILEQETEVQAEAVKAAEQALQYTINQYKAGIATYLQVVIAQATALSNQVNLEAIRSRQMVAHVLLVTALGGGWDAASLPKDKALTSGK